MASPDTLDSVWNDDLPWGFGPEGVVSNEDEGLVVLNLLPEPKKDTPTKADWS